MFNGKYKWKNDEFGRKKEEKKDVWRHRREEGNANANVEIPQTIVEVMADQTELSGRQDNHNVSHFSFTQSITCMYHHPFHYPSH